MASARLASQAWVSRLAELVRGACSKPRSSYQFPAWMTFSYLSFYSCLYPPYSRVYVSLSSPLQKGVCFLDHLSLCDIGWNLLGVSTSTKSRSQGYSVPICCC